VLASLLIRLVAKGVNNTYKVNIDVDMVLLRLSIQTKFGDRVLIDELLLTV
jgi:hypothetical protein